MTLSTVQQPETYVSERPMTLADFHPLVIARVVCEWSRIDREFPMQLWGHEYLGTHVRVGSCRYLIAYNAQQPKIFIQITEEDETTRTQRTWRLWVDQLRIEGTQAILESV